MLTSRLIAVFLACVPGLGLCMGSPVYVIKPIEAWVVDAETGKPIEGAFVTANWQLVTGSLDGTRYKGQLEVKETVTDHAGRFYFEGFSKSNMAMDELRDRDPQILVFKPGYEFVRLTSDYGVTGSDTPGSIRGSRHDNATIRMKRFQGTEKIYASMLIRLYHYLHFVREECNWKKVPRFVSVFVREGERFRGWTVSYDLSVNHLENNPACGSAKDFLGSYLK